MLMYLVLKVANLNVTELKFFYGSTKYTKNAMTDSIYILQVHITDVTEMP